MIIFVIFFLGAAAGFGGGYLYQKKRIDDLRGELNNAVDVREVYWRMLHRAGMLK